jgi:hypothetical protein
VRIVDRAGADDHDQPVQVAPVQCVADGGAAFQHGVRGRVGERLPGFHGARRRQRPEGGEVAVFDGFVAVHGVLQKIKKALGECPRASGVVE